MNSEPWILGVSASPHNGAVCLLKGDEIVVAIQEERLSRVKRDSLRGSRPSLAIKYCLDYAGLRPRDLSLVVCCVTQRAKAPIDDITVNPDLQPKLNKLPTLNIPHHLGHAFSAFATSGFEDSAVLIVDGMGSPFEDLAEDERRACRWEVEDGFETISLYSASGTAVVALEKHLVERGAWVQETGGTTMPRFRSLGGMYSAVAEQIFGDKLEAGKVMGLAPYGRPDIPASEFYTIEGGQLVFRDDVPRRFRHHERWPLRQDEYKNLAASTQAALEEAVLYLVGHLRGLCPSLRLCYAGGVALNSVANERIIRESGFEDVYIMPAAEDSGPAVGAAYYGLWQLRKENSRRKLVHDAVGPEYPPATIAHAIGETPRVQLVESHDVVGDTADLLIEGKIVGWFQGRSELGPRALGQRSILCDPRRPDGKELLNGRVKHREAFRPFAPVVLLEAVEDWFEVDGASAESPFMLRICRFKEDKKSRVPAVVHVDGTGRVQTVTREANGRLYELTKRFYEKTGVPIILNTSFNVMGEPIVETPEDALASFLSTGLDHCVLGDKIVERRKAFLFEPNDIPWYERVKEAVSRAQAAAANGGAAAGPLGRPGARPAGDYVGEFEHRPFGVVAIEEDAGRLRATFKGRLRGLKSYADSSPLAHYRDDIFEVAGGAFTGMKIVFIPDSRGNIDHFVLLIRASFSTDLTFNRRPARGAASNGFPEEFTGRYETAGRILEVSRRDGGELMAGVPGQSPLELVRRRGNMFSLKGVPGYSIEFERSPAGAVIGTVVGQPGAVYRLAKKPTE